MRVCYLLAISSYTNVRIQMIFTGNVGGNNIYVLNDFHDHTCNWGGMAAILIFRQILNLM